MPSVNTGSRRPRSPRSSNARELPAVGVPLLSRGQRTAGRRSSCLLRPGRQCRHQFDDRSVFPTGDHRRGCHDISKQLGRERFHLLLSGRSRGSGGRVDAGGINCCGRILHLVGIASHIVLLAAGTAVRDCSTMGNRRDRVNRRRDADGKSSAHHGASRSHRRSPQGSGLGPELTNPLSSNRCCRPRRSRDGVQTCLTHLHRRPRRP